MTKHDMNEALKTAATRAGMVDLDGLKLADVSKIKLRDDGEVEGAAELLAALKARWPDLFQPKKMRDMSKAEIDAWWQEHARKFPGGAPRAEPMDLSKTKKAKDMSPAEQKKFLDDCKRREW